MGLVLVGYSIDVTPDRLDDVPEVLEVHVVPSDDVRMVPELPTATCDGLEVAVHSSYSSSKKTCSNTCSYFSCGTILKCFLSSFVSVLWSICFLVSETSPIEETGIMIVSGRSD